MQISDKDVEILEPIGEGASATVSKFGVQLPCNSLAISSAPPPGF